MVWVRLDDGFSEHPKIHEVGPIGAWIQIQALCYSNRNLTDGFIPHSAAKTFGLNGTEHIGIAESAIKNRRGEVIVESGRDCNEIDWPERMVDSGLWEEVPGGYLIHDYLKYNPSKEKVLEAREKDLKRKRSIQDSTRNTTGIHSDSIKNLGGFHEDLNRPVPRPGPVPDPVPVPVPVPHPSPSPRPPKDGEKEGEVRGEGHEGSRPVTVSHGETDRKTLESIRRGLRAPKRTSTGWSGIGDVIGPKKEGG